MKGTTRNDDLDELGEDLEELDCVQFVRGNSHELEVKIDMHNNLWGLPSDIYNAHKEYGACIVDFSGVSKDRITVYVEMR